LKSLCYDARSEKHQLTAVLMAVYMKQAEPDFPSLIRQTNSVSVYLSARNITVSLPSKAMKLMWQNGKYTFIYKGLLSLYGKFEVFFKFFSCMDSNENVFLLAFIPPHERNGTLTRWINTNNLVFTCYTVTCLSVPL